MNKPNKKRARDPEWAKLVQRGRFEKTRSFNLRQGDALLQERQAAFKETDEQ